jgi:localization factor PodJL
MAMRETVHRVALCFIPLLFAPLLCLSLSAAADSALRAAIEAYKRGDYSTAYIAFKPIAKDGNPVAQFALGVMYENGQGVPKDYPRSLYWYRKAARQGYARAQNNLGVLHATGRGGSTKHVRAYMWYSLAAAEGNRIAIENKTGLGHWMKSSQIAMAQHLAREFRRGEISRVSWPYTASRDYTPSQRELLTIQRRLASLGYEPGPVDGILGPQTVSAIRAFQQDAGVRVNGKVSARLADQLAAFVATANPLR